jgi:hypothetical protein
VRSECVLRFWRRRIARSHAFDTVARLMGCLSSHCVVLLRMCMNSSIAVCCVLCGTLERDLNSNARASSRCGQRTRTRRVSERIGQRCRSPVGKWRLLQAARQSCTHQTRASGHSDHLCVELVCDRTSLTTGLSFRCSQSAARRTRCYFD